MERFVDQCRSGHDNQNQLEGLTQPRGIGGRIGAFIVNSIEGRWRPGPAELPPKVRLEAQGSSPAPYRIEPANEEAWKSRSERLKEIKNSTERLRISKWSSLYSYDVPVVGLDPALDGLKILHLSDIHFIESDPRTYLEMENFKVWLKQKNHYFDLCFISGDIITKGPQDLQTKQLHVLREISEHAAHSFFTLGNHDYHGKQPQLVQSALEMGARISDINNFTFKIDIHGAKLNIFGVDDSYFGRPRPPANPPPDGEFNILITHNLEAIRANYPSNIDLILSGHTHWGEFRWADGCRFMKYWGYCDDTNRHVRGWDMLTDRTLSYVHPGLARYYVRKAGLRHPPGFVVHTLRAKPLFADPSRTGGGLGSLGLTSA